MGDLRNNRLLARQTAPRGFERIQNAMTQKHSNEDKTPLPGIHDHTAVSRRQTSKEKNGT